MAGAENSLLVMVRSLCSRFELAAACPAPSPLSKMLADEKIESHGLPHPPNRSYSSPRSCRYWVEAMHRLTAIVHTLRPDVIHANNVCAGIAALPAAIAVRTKFVVHARDLSRHRLVTRLCGRFCERVVAVSSTVRDNLVQDGVPRSKVRVIHNAVDAIPLRTSEEKRCPAERPRYRPRFVFANVGQFVPWKNQSLFLEAASCVAEQLPKSEFLLVGDDVFGRNRDYRRQILDYARSSSVADRITFAGWRDDMTRIWPTIDCLVHTADCEPFGRVLIEAMSQRVPVIAVDACGPSEIIENDQIGILVPPNNVDDLVSAMLQIARNPQAAERIGTAGYNHVLSKFTMAQMGRELLDVYAGILTQ